MAFTRTHLPMEWEECWRREKECRKERMIEEGGETFEEENRKLKWIVSYNDSRIGMKKEAEKENEGDNVEEDELQRYHRQSYPSEIFQTLEEMKMENVLTDLILSTEDGLSLHVHSLVMAAVSSIIQQKLQERHGDEKQISLRLGPEVNDSALAAVVEFAYTGAITSLSKENMMKIQTQLLVWELQESWRLSKWRKMEVTRKKS